MLYEQYSTIKRYTYNAYTCDAKQKRDAKASVYCEHVNNQVE
jgi:hypothetical protein